MKKIICDVCRKEISEVEYQMVQYRMILAYSRKSQINIEEGFGLRNHFLRLRQAHPACAKEIERVIKEAVDRYLLLARAEAPYVTLSCQEKS